MKQKKAGIPGEPAFYIIEIKLLKASCWLQKDGSLNIATGSQRLARNASFSDKAK
ncbi:MAG: hypothetical protein H7X84_05820 [Verrucomicrobia bacterium]|nr:hypothetical protein [Prolixibacteraceae bacterium]